MLLAASTLWGNGLRCALTALVWLSCRPFTILAVIAVLVLAPPFLLQKHTEWDEVYLDTARDMAAGRAIYPPRYGFVYPPFAAWVTTPFAHLPVFPARVAWFVINIVCLLLFFRWAWQLSGGKRLEGKGVDRREWLPAGLGLLGGASYAFNALSHHQTDLVIGALMLGGCLALTRSRSWVSAVCFGLAAAFKGPALLWCPYLLWRRRWGAAAGVLAVAVGVNLLPNLFVSPPGGGLWLGEWVRHIVLPIHNSDRQPGMWYADMVLNQSLSGAVGRWYTTEWTWAAEGVTVHPRAGTVPTWEMRAVLGAGMLLLVGGSMLAQGFRSPHFSQPIEGEPPRATLEFSMVLLLMLLLSPMSSKAHFGLLVLPGFCLARLIFLRRDVVLGGLFVAALLAQLFTLRLFGDWAWVGLWYGALSGTTLLRLVACGYALRTGSAPGVRAEPAQRLAA
jgi:hypothetical protein